MQVSARLAAAPSRARPAEPAGAAVGGASPAEPAGAAVRGSRVRPAEE